MSTIADYAQPNPINQNRSGLIGRAVDRYEGPLKVSGTAPYAHEVATPAPPAYGVLVGAEIGCGEVAAVNDAAARAAPGVHLVWHPFNQPPGQGERGAKTYVQSQAAAEPVLVSPKVAYFGQPVALVVADSFEAATHAAHLVQVSYKNEGGEYLFDPAKAGPARGDIDSRVGDFEAAFSAAPIQLDETYSTPIQNHCQMEPCATTAWWEGDKVVVHASVQMIKQPQHLLAETLMIDRRDVHLLSRYIGGGFGGKGSVYEDFALAALAARALGRPVKIALTRQQMFNATVHRPATVQRVRLGATPDGRLTAFALEATTHCARGEPFLERAAAFSRSLYAAPNRLTGHRLQLMDIAVASAMRAPGEAPGMMALEIAMDEMAEKLGLDPIDFRIRNDTQVDPTAPERRFSQRQLARCLQEGAKIFGWDQRKPPRAQKKEGGKLLGMGVAAGFRNNLTMKSGARVTLDAQGALLVETDMTDIGTGSYTIIAQTAAEMLGLPLEKVRVRLGDSNLPASSGSGGQWGGNSATAGVYAACVKLREAVAQKIGVNGDDAVFEHGFARAHGREISLAAAAGQGDLTGEDTIEFAKLQKTFQQSTFAGHFAEVEVDAATCEIRVRRALAVCAAGRVLNPKTARSQVIGAMTMGLGAALMEELAVDEKRGFFPNHDLALYEVPVHADIRAQEVVFLDETDPVSSPMKAKGVGELGICGAAAAIANAVHNATGVRVRDYPVTLDKLIGQLPPP